MTEPEPVGPSPAAESVLRNAGFSLATQLLTSFFTAGLTLFFARRLGADDYGLFGLAISISALMLLPVDLGVSTSAMRFVADHRADLSSVRAVLADALGLKLLLTVPACTLLAVLAGPIAGAYGEPGLVGPLRGVALAVVGQSLMMLYQGCFAALGRIRSQLRVQLVESSVETGSSVLIVLLGGGAAGAAFGRGVGYVVGGAFALAVMAKLLGGGVLPRRLRGTGRMRSIGRYAIPLLVINGAYTLFEQIDVLLIGALKSATQVGLFQAPLRLTTFLQYPGAALAYAVAPNLAGGEPMKAGTRFETAFRVLILLDAALVPPVLIWADPIVRLALGAEYGGSVPVLRAFAPLVFLNGLVPLAAVSLNYVGQAGRRLPVAVAAVAVNAGVDVVLIPRIGIVGGVVGTTVALALYAAVHVNICRGAFGIRLKPLAFTLLRATLAAAAMAGVLALPRTTHLSPIGWVLWGLGGLAAFAFVLAATGEVRAADVLALRETLVTRSTPS